MCFARSLVLAAGFSGALAAMSGAAAASRLDTVYSFAGGSDGFSPEAALIYRGGVLYGTTSLGGGTGCGGNGCGTVFAVTPEGTEHVVYAFQGGTDGFDVFTPLVEIVGTLYGTTVAGGANGAGGGTEFSVTLAGAETVLHSFGGTNDGVLPSSGLTRIGGIFFGVTYSGGSHNAGTVFKTTRGGKEKVLHDFSGSDGAEPSAGLIDVGGTLYGAACGGGAYGAGTVFSITQQGALTVLYSFKGASNGDGVCPRGRLTSAGGTLYGTTYEGGAGGGTVFALTADGTETVLHSFQGGSDGTYPEAGLLLVGGTLYGTTIFGGGVGPKYCGKRGCGTVFSVTPGGSETVVHAFINKNGEEGSSPYAELIQVGGKLYGTTLYGGATGHGTVFSITP